MYELLKPAIAGPGGARREKRFYRFRTAAWITGAILTVKGKFGPPGGALLAGETRGQRLPINPFSRRGRWTTGERCRQPIETTDDVLAAGRRGSAPHACDPGLAAAS